MNISIKTKTPIKTRTCQLLDNTAFTPYVWHMSEKTRKTMHDRLNVVPPGGNPQSKFLADFVTGGHTLSVELSFPPDGGCLTLPRREPRPSLRTRNKGAPRGAPPESVSTRPCPSKNNHQNAHDPWPQPIPDAGGLIKRRGGENKDEGSAQ